MTLNRKSQGQGHTERLQLEIWSKSLNMQSIMFEIINMNESKLKRKG